MEIISIDYTKFTQDCEVYDEQDVDIADYIEPIKGVRLG